MEETGAIEAVLVNTNQVIHLTSCRIQFMYVGHIQEQQYLALILKLMPAGNSTEEFIAETETKELYS